MKKYLFIILFLLLIFVTVLYMINRQTEFEAFMSNFDGDVELTQRTPVHPIQIGDDGYEEQKHYYADYLYNHIYTLNGEMFTVLIREVQLDCYALIRAVLYYDGEVYTMNGDEVETRHCVVIDDVDMSSFDLEEVMLYAKEQFEIE